MKIGEPKRQRRWPRIVVFLTVVWTIGGSFLLMQSFAVKATDAVLHRFGTGLAIPAQSPEAKAHCSVLLSKNRPSTASLLSGPQAKYAAWRLGLQFGLGFASHDTGRVTPDQEAKALAEAQGYAHKLGVPEVAFPQEKRTPYRLSAFVYSLEDDPQCVQAALSKLYSKQHGNLYLFGAAAGVAYVYRLSVPQAGPALAPQIRRYGTAAGLPDALWEPLTENPPTDEAASQKATLILTNIDRYLKPAEQ